MPGLHRWIDGPAGDTIGSLNSCGDDHAKCFEGWACRAPVSAMGNSSCTTSSVEGRARGHASEEKLCHADMTDLALLQIFMAFGVSLPGQPNAQFVLREGEDLEVRQSRRRNSSKIRNDIDFMVPVQGDCHEILLEQHFRGISLTCFGVCL